MWSHVRSSPKWIRAIFDKETRISCMNLGEFSKMYESVALKRADWVSMALKSADWFEEIIIRSEVQNEMFRHTS